MAGILSKGIKFSVAEYTGSTVGTYSEVANLQEIPSLGGTPEKVETTTLANGNRTYIAGIKDFGDLAFKFLFDGTPSTGNYAKLRDLEKDANGNPKTISIKIELPDALTAGTGTHHGTQFVFDAQISNSLDSAAVNAALTFTCNAALQSDITVTAAA